MAEANPSKEEVVMEKEDQLMHFTKEGELYHAWYSIRERRGSFHWTKVPGSEAVCFCPEREGDRRALLGITAQ